MLTHLVSERKEIASLYGWSKSPTQVRLPIKEYTMNETGSNAISFLTPVDFFQPDSPSDREMTRVRKTLEASGDLRVNNMVSQMGRFAETNKTFDKPSFLR